MRILFAGTPEIAVPSLEALAAEHDVAAVLTSPDKASGRRRKLTPSPVKAKALELGLKVIQPEKLDSAARSEIADLECSLLVVFAYGRIFGPKFLALFPQGGINIHPSALPLYRGPSPVTEVILRGDPQTALTVQKLALEMDAGDILSARVYPLTGKETTASLSADIAREAAVELKAAVDNLEKGRAEYRPQNHADATYCSMVEKKDGIIDWQKSASVIEREVRAYNPWPRSRTLLNGDPLIILESSVITESDLPENIDESVPGQFLGVDKLHGILIKTGNGVLGITRLQPASRKPLDFRSFMNGFSIEKATILGDNNES